MKNTDLRAYIEQRCIPIPFVGCWMWLFSVGSHGYGQAKHPQYRDNALTTAHRIAYEAFNGPIPKHFLVQHKCDQRWCVNPDHLELGTDKTNCADKERKGRHGYEKRLGMPGPNRKLTLDEAALIRSSRGTEQDLAVIFGVNQSVIGNILRGKTYKGTSLDIRPKALLVGDTVSWCSKRTVKVGMIVDVIAAGNVPGVRLKDTRRSGLVARERESYIVAVGNKMYWPLVSILKETPWPAL